MNIQIAQPFYHYIMVFQVVCFDAYPNKEWIKTVPNAEYVDLDTLYGQANMISIHVPLLKETKHMINQSSIAKMQDNVIIVNTSRGEVVKTHDLVQGLKCGKIFGIALDVFEGEKQFMFKDMSEKGFEHHPDLEELVSMDNVIISSHIAFYTDESVRQISEKTFQNFDDFIKNENIDESAFVV